MTTCASAAMAAYDDAVPHPAADIELARRFARIRAGRPAVELTDIDVVLLVSSSRGGSSMLAEVLRRHSQLLSLPGELNPYVVLAQLAGGDGQIVREELARDVGRPAVGSDPDVDRRIADTVFRIALQWPHLDLDEAESAARATATASAQRCSDEFTADVLHRLALPTGSYDIAGTPPPPLSPPDEPIVEMAPYLGFRQWQPPAAGELRRCPVVVATPRNSYRLRWLQRLFGGSRVRVVHLTRNPAAAVNGLVDGWRHGGFFSTPVPERLRIPGYSERHPWGQRWWNYDVPPRWRELVAVPVAAVAAEQWRSAHHAVVETDGMDTLRVRYEDAIGSTEQRASVGRALAAFLDLDERETVDAVVTGTRPVMATAPPAPRRWSRSDHDLAPALAEPAVWEMAVELGYDVDERLWI